VHFEKLKQPHFGEIYIRIFILHKDDSSETAANPEIAGMR